MQHEGKSDVTGRIVFPQERNRFFITIEPIKRNPSEIETCKRSAVAFMEMLARGGAYQDHDKNMPNIVYPRRFLTWDCFTKDKLLVTLEGQERPQELRAYDLQFEFIGIAPP